MAAPKISKMVTDRQRRCEFVEQFVRTHAREVAEALRILLEEPEEPPQNQGGDPPRRDVPEFLSRLLQRLREALEELIAAERAHLDELANDGAPRERRNRAAADLRRHLFDLRHLFRGSYGHDAAEAMGFERRIAQDPLALLRQGQHVVARLRDPQLELPPSRHELFQVSRAATAGVIRPRLRKLRAALDDVNRERGKAQGTKIAKDRAMEVFDETYLLISRMLVTAFRLAGKHKLAAQIPTSLRHRPRRGHAGPEAKN